MQGGLAGVAVLFDLDGTLIDTAADLAASMNHALSKAGRNSVPLARVRHLVGQGARAMIARGLAETGAPPADADALDAHVAVFLDHYLAHIADASRPFPGAVAAVEALKSEGAAIAICTNKREVWARALIEALGLAPLFNAIIGSDSAGAAKPDPRPVLRCLRLTRAATGVFVGDSDTDIRAADAAGLPMIAALFGYGPLDLVDRAAARFSAYGELPALVRQAVRR